MKSKKPEATSPSGILPSDEDRISLVLHYSHSRQFSSGHKSFNERSSQSVKTYKVIPCRAENKALVSQSSFFLLFLLSLGKVSPLQPSSKLSLIQTAFIKQQSSSASIWNGLSQASCHLLFILVVVCYLGCYPLEQHSHPLHLTALELTIIRAAGQQAPWIHWDSTFYRLNYPSAKPHLWFIFTEAISIHTFYTYATYPKAFIIHGQRPFYVSRS